MMQVTTDNRQLADGMQLIAEVHNLRQEVHKLRVLMAAADHVAQREEEALRSAEEKRKSDEQAARDRQREEDMAHYERVINRDYRGDHYLRKLYGPGRPGTRRMYD